LRMTEGLRRIGKGKGKGVSGQGSTPRRGENQELRRTLATGFVRDYSGEGDHPVVRAPLS